MTRISELTTYLETIAPPSLQASYDNSGLLVGDKNKAIEGVLISLDCTETIIEEAVERGCNVVVAHHPIIFGGLKRLTGKTYVERTVITAIKNDVAIYAIHTNLDSVLKQGVNGRIAQRLGLENIRTLAPSKNQVQKLAVYVPKPQVEEVANAMFGAGAGEIGDYDQASFRTSGTGTFRGLEGSNPAIGSVGETERVEEFKLEVVVPRHRASSVLAAARNAHPYEEMAYDLFDIEATITDYGMGAIGDLPEALSFEDWLAHLCSKMELPALKHTEAPDRPIKRIAICGGAGGVLLNAAKGQKADVFVTSDYKYHEFFDAEGALSICDIGHYESERYTINLLHELISSKFGTFAALKTHRNTNPVRFYVPRTANSSPE